MGGYEQGTEGQPYCTKTGRLEFCRDEPEFRDSGETLPLHREPIDSTFYEPNVIVAEAHPLLEPKSPEAYGARTSDLEADDRQARHVIKPWRDVKNTQHPLMKHEGFSSEHLPDSNPASTAPMAEVMATPEGRAGLPAVALGNPMSQIDRAWPVEQATAEGFGTLSTQQQQDARGHAVYQDGYWTVVITRPLNTADGADATLAVGGDSGINFAVWDGGDGDVGGRKSYSMFTPLHIAETE